MLDKERIIVVSKCDMLDDELESELKAELKEDFNFKKTCGLKDKLYASLNAISQF